MKGSRKYTTMEIGRMLGVNYTTVNNWIRAGKLQAYQTPGGHRRVSEEDLVNFINSFDMPLPEEIRARLRPDILIVDDEDLYLGAFKRWFSRFTDYNVIATNNGMEALLIAGEKKPSLIVLDILMPGMDGVEVCRVLKSRSTTRDIQVIGISGKADDGTRDEMLQVGALECLNKTMPLEQMAQVLERYLKTRPAAPDQQQKEES